MNLKIVAISDTHNKHKQLSIPECDILIHAGDATSKGWEREVRDFAKWFENQPARYKIYTPGNHEVWFEKELPHSKTWFTEECPSGIVLMDESLDVEGIKIYASPQTPWFWDWAFNKARNQHESDFRHVSLIKPYWDAIPNDTDVLITHGPPYEILDELQYIDGTPKGQFVGCQDLLEAVKRVKPDLHFFGHIHCAYGEKHTDGTSFYNVANCDEMYSISNPITIVDYKTKLSLKEKK